MIIFTFLSVRQRITLLISFLLLAFTGFATDPVNPAEIQSWMESSQIKFQENKGQVTDINGSPVSEVLFTAHTGGIQLFITTEGVSYVFSKIERKKKDNEKQLVATELLKALKNKKLYKEKKDLSIEYWKLNMNLEGAEIKKENIIMEYPASGVFNYYLPHKPDGIFDVKEYSKITIKNIYPGIDWVLYGAGNKGMKYDFILHPGADVSDINMIYRGASDIKLTGNTGEEMLQITTPFGKLEEGALFSYDEETKMEIPSHYEVINTGNGVYKVKFDFGKNGVSAKTVVIDPPLVWATYYGGIGMDGPQDIEVNKGTGDIFVTGYSMSGNTFPTQNPGGGAYYVPAALGACCFVLKFNSNGVRQWCTYYTGIDGAYAMGITSDYSGNLYLTGGAYALNFIPLSPVGSYSQAPGSNDDACIVKFSSTGVLQWATLYGGNNQDWGSEVVTDKFGNVFLTGGTGSTNLPLANPGGGAYAQSNIAGIQNAFIVKFNPVGALIWATYYGGDEDYPTDIDVDCRGDIYITGYTTSGFMGSPALPTLNPGGGAFYQGNNNGIVNSFISKFSGSGVFLWGTYFGSNHSYGDYISSCDIDRNGNVFITGYGNNGIPIRNWPGAYNQPATPYSSFDGARFVSKFSPLGVLIWSTFYEGGGDAIVTDRAGNIYIASTIGGPPVAAGTVQTLNPGGGSWFQGNFAPNGAGNGNVSDVYLSKFNSAGVLQWATYYGNNAREWVNGIACNDAGCIFVTGEWTTQTNSLPNGSTVNNTLNPGGGAYYQGNHSGGDTDDGFIAEFCGTPIPSPTPLTFTAPPVCFGDTIQFVLSDTSGILSVQWNFGNPASGILNTSTQQSASHVFTAPGTYSTTVVIEYLCYFDTVKQQVHILKPAANAGPDVSLCMGSATQLNGSGGASCSWSPASALTNTGIYNPVATPTITTTYIITVTDTNGCINTDTMTIAVNPLPVIIASGDTTICSAASAQLSAAGGVIYAWTPSAGLNNSAISNPLCGPISGSTTYTVIGTDANGCSGSDTVSIIALASPVVSVGPSDTICAGMSAQLSAGGGSSYVWSPSVSLSGASIANPVATPANTTTYTVILTAPNGCTDHGNIMITVLPVPIANAGANVAICSGGSVQLNATGGTIYSWSPLAGLSAGNIPNPVASPSSSSVYIVTASNGICSDDDTVNVTVNPLPLVSFISDDTAGCPLLCVNFTNTSPNAVSSAWSFGDGGTSSAYNSPHCYTSTGQYNVSLTVTDANGCTNSAMYTNYINVYPTPVAGFTATPKTVTLIDPTVHFMDKSSGADQWHWSFGDADNSSSFQQHAQFTYSDTGSYFVQLVVSNAYGCSDTATEIVKVRQDFVIYIPNTFTPNGDGKNDGFIPEGLGIDLSDFKMWIFDRWGNLIYETNDMNKPWDGRANGGNETAQIDTYVWKISAQSIYGKKIQQVGHVNLIE